MNAVVIGDSIVWHVHATLAKGKVHTHCLPGARVLDVSVQIPAILKDDETCNYAHIYCYYCCELISSKV